MGAGKTTIGRALAKSLDKSFIDSDQEIEIRTGVSIPLIFELEGEAGFRVRERMAIEDLTNSHNIVLATGGGVVTHAQNRAMLKERGLVIYLYADIEQLFARTSKDRNRPLLQTHDPKAVLQELITQREPLYRQTADIVCDTGDGSVRQLVQQLIHQIDQWPNKT